MTQSLLESKPMSQTDRVERRAGTRPHVLMITGAYIPEMSGGGLQCRTLIQALRDRVDVTVLTTSTDASLPREADVEGVRVCRVRVDPTSWGSKARAARQFLAVLMRLRRSVQIIHLHGFSQKSWLAILVGRLAGIPLIIKCTSVGDDDPAAIRRRGWMAFQFWSRADRYVGVSPRLQTLCREAGITAGALRWIPNGVDLERFRPGDADERHALRTQLGLPSDLPLILFVGFFSREKQPDLLATAWMDMLESGGPSAALVMVGPTRSRYAEVDTRLAEEIQREAIQRGVADRLLCVERSMEIEQYYRCADLFVLPSSREGLPNALLEAMASGLPCIASRLPGVTDQVLDDGRVGILVPVGDRGALRDALRSVLAHPERGWALGQLARSRIKTHFAIEQVADHYVRLYQGMISRTPNAASTPSRSDSSLLGSTTMGRTP